MKTKIISTILFLALAGFADVVPDTKQAVREYKVKVVPLANLSATTLRMTDQGWALDPDTGKPVLSYSVEAWAQEVADGVTNNVIIQRRTFVVPQAKLAQWLQSTNGFAFLKAALLSKSGMTEDIRE